MTQADRPIATLALAAAGAGIFWLLGFPAAPLTGPAAFVAVGAMFGLRASVPHRLRDAIFVVLGLSIGTSVTPEVLGLIVTLPVSLAVLVATLLLSIALNRLLLRRLFGFTPLNALLAATPGHLSFIMGLSDDLKADLPRITLVQSIRVVLLTLLVPVIIAAWGVEGTARGIPAATIGPAAFTVLSALSLGAGLLFRRLAVPAALLLGALGVSALGHGSGLTPGALPDWLVTAALTGMGGLIGSRFRGFAFSELTGALLAGVLATLVSCICAAIGALIVAAVLDLPVAGLLLAFAPGGVEVMAAIAIETGLGAAVVAMHHVFRLLVLSALIPVLVRRVGGRAEGR
ncbi:AbrB family transcriptional regulator [Profundibacterium mesophilum]|uniref:Ammonia monooxygenase General function prediction only n=1 Tax=Profundibacterium mesophilum KAUST100406-0324 TaxID=1037889 RepID=A0A921NXJ1_9RHOB|nr:AbrB family transcriptional regulator [Profundibacterium mesophilum]KAF0677186.1 putative ammonia monooxygenase General function prediction only [Profundibacterium mesophilum KAUST100406-0324]